MMSRSGGLDPASRYDPSAMGRCIDPEAELFDHKDNKSIDPEAELFDHIDNKSIDTGSINSNVTRNNNSSSSDRSKVAVLISVLFAVLVGFAALAFAVSWSLTASDRETTGTASAASITRSARFIPPPDDLAELCAPMTILTEEGFDKCKEHCVRAECCFLPEDNSLSCQPTQKDDCSAYEYSCNTLDKL